MGTDPFAGIPLDPGTRIGPYRVESFLARGGMGLVLRGVDENLERPVALKLVAPALGNDPEFRERFARECKVLAAVRHPNIVTIYYQGDFEGVPYFAMELVDGSSLDERVETGGPVDWRRAAAWMSQCCQALEAARTKGVIHRDLKPANILIDAEEQVRIVDFGLARTQDVSKALTSASTVLGTPYFVSPEQASGRKIDWRADLYSLAASFYWVVSGRPVFDAEEAMDVLIGHVRDPATPLGQVAPRLPAGLCRLIDRLLSKRPDDRAGSSYQQVIDELRRVLDEGGADESVDLAVTSVRTPVVADGFQAWLIPDEATGGPDVALLEADSLGFGASTENPLFLPDVPGQRRRLSRWHGAFERTEKGYQLRVGPGRGGAPLPRVSVGDGPALEAGLHPVEPGDRLDLGSVVLTVSGSHGAGLHLDFEPRDNPRAERYQGRWCFVLLGERLVAGAAGGAGLTLPGAPESFALELRDGELWLEARCHDLVVGDTQLEAGKGRALVDGVEIRGPGFAYRLSLRDSPAGLWDH